MFNSLTTFLIHMVCYWTMVWKYDTHSNSDSFRVAICNSLKNQICCTLPSTILFFNFYKVEHSNIISSIFLIPVVIVISDIYFFLTHYPLHKTFLWKYHKTHHQGPVHVVKSLDADLVEHFLCNLGSFIFPFIVFQYMNLSFNIYIFNIWVALSTINTCVSHLGFKSLGDKGIHHLHHKYLKYNFGTGFYIMDRICGTYIENVS